MKKKLLAASLITVCISLPAYSTFAYFTAEDKAHNIVKAGGVDISIVEWQMQNGKRVPYPTDAPIKIMPDTRVSKIPTVESYEQDTYIRVNLKIIIKDKDGNVIELTDDEIKKFIKIQINEEYWLTRDPDDGWWYYRVPVGGGKATEPLFEEVFFSGADMGNEFSLCTIEIDVNAQGVQAANNGDTVFDAAGWE